MKIKHMQVLLFLSILSCRAYASEIVPMHKLFEEADRYEGQKVEVKGEAVGDIMGDGETYWVNVKDGDFFIGIVLDSRQKGLVKNLGRYRVKGDIVRVSGIYNVHCPLHYGERDIHAETIEIVEEGRRIEEKLETDKIILSVLLGLITIIFIYHSHRMKHRKGTGGPHN
ncbi:MAG: hypothetical protein JW957_05860 [Candidatus Omnitrophica bacterium]|nr:hypothetical protein [Candidatus Omnitrophota bacterium]